MSNAVLPKIKVNDPRNLDGSAAGAAGLESPSTTTDGGHSGRPKSGSSSEGMVILSPLDRLRRMGYVLVT
jgi:hypothetical protein